ncbi:MAG TPA: beta-L-arabinofuranosidase domain-containing protein, partial [Gemmatimonadaceae bacterium]|nr:beta-L-arabinofuranosidase domain-containing protein [Gemmatimonadaceae bacterium]
MTRDVSRREFMVGMAAATAGAALWPRTGVAALLPVHPGPAGAMADAGARVHPFDVRQVRLGPSAFRDAMEVNRRYLMALEPGRLLHMFRVTAGLPSSAEPLGGWEAPDNELRGHFAGGHYLSACALLGA